MSTLLGSNFNSSQKSKLNLWHLPLVDYKRKVFIKAVFIMTVLTILYSFLHFIFSILSTFLLLISYFPASFTYGTQLTFTYSKSTIETPEHLLKVNNKDTRTSLMLFWCLQFWRDFTHCSGVSIVALCKSCPNAEFYWFIFSHIWTEYGDFRSKSPYSVQIRENTDRKTPYLDTFHAVSTLLAG